MTQPTRGQAARKAAPMNPRRTEAATPNPPRLGYDPDADRFALPPGVTRPQGVRYEWKRYLMLGQPDAKNMAQLKREGWKPVPASRHPEMAGGDEWAGLMTKHDHIQLDDCILCERPETQCQAVEAYFHDKTAEMTAAKEAELGESKDPKNFPRTQPRVRQTVEGPDHIERPMPRGNSDENFEDD